MSTSTSTSSPGHIEKGLMVSEDSTLLRVVSRIPADRLTATGSGCFENIGKECVLYVPRGAKRTYEKMLGWNNFAKIVEMDM